MLQPSPKSSGARRQATITACLRHCFHKRCLKLLNTLRDASHFQWLLLCALPVISLDVSLSWTEDSFLEVFEDGWRTLSYASTGFPFYFLRFSSKLIGSATMWACVVWLSLLRGNPASEEPVWLLSFPLTSSRQTEFHGLCWPPRLSPGLSAAGSHRRRN